MRAGLSLSGEQHARAAIEVHVSARGGNQRALRAVRSRRVQVQAVEPEDALAIGSQLARGIQSADRASGSAAQSRRCRAGRIDRGAHGAASGSADVCRRVCYAANRAARRRSDAADQTAASRRASRA